MQCRFKLPSIILSIVVAALAAGCATNGEANWLPRLPDAGVSVTQSDRADCALIRGSDLLSPQEGIWFQTHCLPASAHPQGVASSICNRPSLDVAEFGLIAPGLHVYRQTVSSSAFLWYATGPDCFALVSDRLVTYVCTDRAISFRWDPRAACAGHAGVLARINGQ